MEHSEILFKQVIDKGEEAIDEFIDNRESENLFLDFKRSSNNGNGRKLSQDDRFNLAKAISGFGNSEGGIVLWGVDCREYRQEDDYADVARAKFPITDPQRFKSWLEGAVSNTTIPPQKGVVHHIIYSNNSTETGFVVTHIPKSNFSPHQVISSGSGQYRYYIRAGSDFVPTPHAVLAGMFGRRPQPSVFHMYSDEYPEVLTTDPQTVKTKLGLQLYNKGPGVASDLFMTLTIFSSPGENCKIKINPGEEDFWKYWTYVGVEFSAINKPEFRLPPQSRLHPFILEMQLVPPFTKKLEIVGTCGCGEAPIWNFKLEKEAAEIEAQYLEFLEKYRVDTTFRPNFWVTE